MYTAILATLLGSAAYATRLSAAPIGKAKSLETSATSNSMLSSVTKHEKEAFAAQNRLRTYTRKGPSDIKKYLKKRINYFKGGKKVL